MNILITGVAGFIGSFLARQLLLNGHNIIGIDNFDPFYNRKAKEFNLDLIYERVGESSKNFNRSEVQYILENLDYGLIKSKQTQKNGTFFNFYEADIRNVKSLEKIFLENKIDCIVHLAAMAGVTFSIKDPIKYTQVNNEGSVKILEFTVKHNVKNFVFASSSSVYGSRTDVPFREEQIVNTPISPYAATKRMCEIMNFTYHNLYEINISNLRFFTVYGPLQRPYGMAIQKFIKQVDRGEPITIYGDGSMSRDYTYIDDIVDGIILSIEKNNGYNTYNLGNKEPVSLSKLSNEIIKQMGRGEVVNLECPPTEVPITFAEISKAEKELGYDPKTNIESGLKKQIEIYKLMGDWYKV